MARAATSPELVLYRTPGKKSKFRAAIFQPTVIYTARINQSFSTLDGVLEITYDTGSGTLADVLPDMTVLIGSTAGAHDIGIVRLRDKDALKFYIGETSDVAFANDQYLTVIDDFGLWARHVRISAGVPYMDGTTAYSDQHTNFDPVPIMGSHRVLKLTGATVSTSFNAASSYCIDSSISGYAWSAPGSSSSSGMTTSTPSITWNSVGWKKVYLTLTAANGKTFFGVRYVYVWNDANPPPRAQIEECRADADEGGWMFDITLLDDCDLDAIRDRSLVILFKEDYYGSTQSNIGPVAGCENIECTGWIARETINWNPEQGSVRFGVFGAHFWFSIIPSYPDGVELVARAAAAWTEIRGLTVNKGLYHFLRWRTTATRIMDVTLTDDTKYTREVSSLAQNLWEQLREMAFLQIFARAGVNAIGQLFIQVHPQLVPEASRTWPTVLTITGQDWVGEINFDRAIRNETAQVNLSGVAVNENGRGTPYFALSTGHTYSHYGRPEIQDNLLVASQADANQKAGLYYGWRNNPYPDIPIVFDADIALIDCFPLQQCDITIEAADTPRGIAYSGGLIPKSVAIVQDPETGVVHREVTFEAETFEAPSVNGDVPGSDDVSVPPTPSLPPLPDFPIIIPGVPVVDPEDGGPSTVLLHDVNSGLIYTENFHEASPTWRTVNAGLTQDQYQNVNAIVVTPSLEIYVAYLDNDTDGTIEIFLAYAPSIGSTFTIIEDLTSIRAKHAGVTVSITALAVDPLTGRVGYILVGKTSNAKLYVGTGTSFVGSVITGYQFDAPHYPASLSYGFGSWVVTGPVGAFVHAGWFRMDAAGSGVLASGDTPVSTHYYHRRASTTDLIYHFSDTNGTCRSSTGNCNIFSSALGDGLLNTAQANRHASDPNGIYWMLSYGGAAGKGRSSDGIATIVGVPNLPSGEHKFAYAGGEGIASRWVVASGIIRYSPDWGDTWTEKGGSILGIAPIPNFDVVKVIGF
jgi:hypothetical protein